MSESRHKQLTDLFQNIPLPSAADEEEPHILDPKMSWNAVGVLTPSIKNTVDTLRRAGSREF